LSDLAPLGMDDELARELWGLVSPLPIEGAVDLDKDVAVVFAGEQECVPRVPNVEAIGLAVERASSGGGRKKNNLKTVKYQINYHMPKKKHLDYANYQMTSP
jgi:hypothetical protein